MPTYEYECTKCGHRFEFFQNMKEEPLKKCPKCSSSLKRLIGAGAGIIFKGSGFYATDYKMKKPRPETTACPKTNDGKPACDACKLEKK